MKLFIRFTGPFLLLLLACAQAASITTLRLSHRPAAEIIPVVKPMLGPGDAISGQGFKIFLRSSPATLAQVREMIDALDVSRKMLLISVFQGNSRGLETLGIGGSIRIETGDASIAIGAESNGNSGRGGSIATNAGSDRAEITGSRTRMRLEDNPIHQIRVTEGTEAYIETGKQIPYFSGARWITPESVAGALEFRDVTSGFYVLARLHGDGVTLRISPFRHSPGNALGGNVETRQASTRINGQIGEWLLVGGVTEQVQRTQGSTGSYSSTQGRKNEAIWIRADLVR